jgi:hypothetical protein
VPQELSHRELDCPRRGGGTAKAEDRNDLRLEETPDRKKRRAKVRKNEEQRWAAKAGPVKIYYRDPVTGEEREEPSQ